MEIRISALDGVHIPDDCIVNVSVGDVQKQARYDPRKLYRFRDPKRTAKIDLYQQIGSCDVTWNIDEPASVSCVAKGSSGPGIPLSVNVAPVNVAKDVKEKATERSEKADASNKARQYLKEHAVEDLLTRAMRELLKAMPQDSYQFLSEFIANKGVVPAPPPPPPHAATANAAPTAAAACSSTAAAATQQGNDPLVAKDLSRIRSQACEVLMKASNNGSLNDVLTEIMEDRPKGGGKAKQEKDVVCTAAAPAAKKDLVALRVQAADVLMKASFDGTLKEVLTDIRGDQVPKKTEAAADKGDGSPDENFDAEQAQGATKIQAQFRGQQSRKQMNTEKCLAMVEMPFLDKISLGMPLSMPMLFI